MFFGSTGARGVCRAATALVFLSYGLPCLAAPVPPTSPETVLQAQLARDDVRGALQTAKGMADPREAYAAIAAHQTARRRFDDARAAVRRIRVGTSRRPEVGLIDRCRALTGLAAGLAAAGRGREADQALRVATQDAQHIPGIFAEMGEGFGIQAAARWIDIASLQIRLGERARAAHSLGQAEERAAGSSDSGTSAAILARVENGRRALGDRAGAAKAHREWRLANAGAYGQTGDVGLKVFGYVQVDAEDGDPARVLEDIKRHGWHSDPVDVLCFAARTMSRAHIPAARRDQLLEAARARSRVTRDADLRRRYDREIAEAASGSTAR